MPEARADATALALGDTVYVFGGTGLAGPTTTIYRLKLTKGLPDGPGRWHDCSAGPARPRRSSCRSHASSAMSFSANGSIYVIGGVDGSGAPQDTTLWAVPDATTGDLPPGTSWTRPSCPRPRASSGIAAIGSYAFVIGGQGTDGALDSIVRANISPLPPYFQLGILGATIPGLSIKGEIGQQLGYINAMTVGMINFVLLVLLGYALSHRDASMRLLEKLSRGRIKAPREDEYVPGP